MSDKKIGIFSAFLFFGIAALFVPATALQNSIAMGQEFYPEYEENEYYDKEYDHTKIIMIIKCSNSQCREKIIHM